MALCLGLALWLSVQGWVLPRLGLQIAGTIAPDPPEPPPSTAVWDPQAQPQAQPLPPQVAAANRPAWLAPGPWPLGLPAPLALGQSLLPAPAQAIAQSPEPQTNPGRIVIDLSDRRLYLYGPADHQAAIAEYDVAIGQDGWETPLGSYLIGDLQKNPTWQHPLTHEVIPPGPDNPLGAAWIGFKLTPDYALGIHGTLDESLVGQAVSHGCVRMRNSDILALYDQLQLGWPLEVRP